MIKAPFLFPVQDIVGGMYLIPGIAGQTGP
jgi:hypothetical protein